MTKLTRAGMLIAVFFVGCATGGAASQFVVPEADAQGGVAPETTGTGGVQKWDYLCINEYSAEDIMEKAKVAGRQGWEMVFADGLGNNQAVCFKRPM